jgi:hypothetical protein
MLHTPLRRGEVNPKLLNCWKSSLNKLQTNETRRDSSHSVWEYSVVNVSPGTWSRLSLFISSARVLIALRGPAWSFSADVERTDVMSGTDFPTHRVNGWDRVRKQPFRTVKRAVNIWRDNGVLSYFFIWDFYHTQDTQWFASHLN